MNFQRGTRALSPADKANARLIGKVSGAEVTGQRLSWEWKR